MFAFDSLKLRLGDCLQMSVVAEDLGEQTFFGANLGNATVGLTFEPTIVTEFFAALMGSHRNWRLGAVDSAGSHQCLTGNHISTSTRIAWSSSKVRSGLVSHSHTDGVPIIAII